MTLSLALRNLLRHRRRSLATLAAMAVGLASMLIFGGYARNGVLATQTGYVQYHGHLQIQRQGFFEQGSGNPIAYGIADYREIIDTLRRDPVLGPMLVVITPTLRLNGIAGHASGGSSEGSSHGVVAAGVVPEDQNRMHEWDDHGVASYAPTIPLAGTPPDAAVAGTGVARMLGLCAPLGLPRCPAIPGGDARDGGAGPAIPPAIEALAELARGDAAGPAAPTRIELLVANLHGAPNVGSLDVVKAENWGVKEIDDSLIVMHLAQAQRLLYGAGQPQVTAIQIQLAHTAQIPAARARLGQLLEAGFPGQRLAVLDYETLTPIYRQVIQFFDSLHGFVSILIAVIVLFTVGNTMSTAVAERTAEIGTIRALGRRRSAVRRLFICEAALLGLAGAAAGVLVALPAAWLINHSGMTWAPPGYSYAYPVMVRVWGDAGLLLGAAGTIVAVAIASAWWPARRGARLVIVDALRK